MKIDVKIYDVGAIPDKKALAHTLQVAFADLKATWISSNELVPGSSLNNSLKRLESLFTMSSERMPRPPRIAQRATVEPKPKDAH